jgi:hypothetical protein
MADEIGTGGAHGNPFNNQAAKTTLLGAVRVGGRPHRAGQH